MRRRWDRCARTNASTSSIVATLGLPAWQGRYVYESMLLGAVQEVLLLAPVYGPLGTAWSVLFAELGIACGLMYATEVRYRQLAIWRRRS